MNKKLILYTILTLIILFLILGGVFLFINNKNENTSTSNNIIFPFLDNLVENIFNNNQTNNLVDLTDNNQTETKEGLIQYKDLFPINFNFYNDLVVLLDKKTDSILNLDPDSGETKRITTTLFRDIKKIEFIQIENFLYIISINNNDLLSVSYIDINLSEIKEVNQLDSINDVYDFSISPEGNRLFYLSKINNRTFGFIKDIDRNNSITVLDFPFTDLLSQWVNPSIIAIYPKPSYYRDGFLFFLNPLSGDLRKIMSDIKSFDVKVNPSGTKILYSHANRENTPNLSLYDIENNTYKNITTSFIDKCFWYSEENFFRCAVPKVTYSYIYPDDWYKGKYKSEDLLVIFDEDEIIGEDILPQPVDIEILKQQPEGSIIFFKDKKTSNLWSWYLD